MANFVIKEAPAKRDPKHTGRDPEYAKWEKQGRKKWETMKHTMPESEKKEYLKKVANNPHNVLGQPALFPAIPLFSSLSGVRELTQAEKEIVKLEKFEEMGIIDEEFWCNKCEALTVHALSGTDCFCKKCGDHKPYRRVPPTILFSDEIQKLIANAKKDLTHTP
jgi:hypothetical protein